MLLPSLPILARTIPTGVGKTNTAPQAPPSQPDHPHGRGENAFSGFRSEMHAGPSPRAWGKQGHSVFHSVQPRTIPTGVGKTNTAPQAPPSQPDHPHGRGENAFSGFRSEMHAGPSPRAWGKQGHSVFHSVQPRTIPTGVGKTGSLPCSARLRSDHPHGRGENCQRT